MFVPVWVIVLVVLFAPHADGGPSNAALIWRLLRGDK
jgi:hypothetical protein